MRANVKLYLLTAVLVSAMVALLTGCADIGDNGTNSNIPSGPEASDGVTLGTLDLYYNLETGEGTGTFTPSAEASAEVALTGITPVWGASSYWKGTQLAAASGVDAAIPGNDEGPLAIIGLGLASELGYVIAGPEFGIASVATGVTAYANGAAMTGSCYVLDAEDAAGGAPTIAAYVGGKDGLAPFNWAQSTAAAQANMTVASPTTTTSAYWRFGQLTRGTAAAPAYAPGADANWQVTTTAPVDLNMQTMAIVLKVPVAADGTTPDAVAISGTLTADAVFSTDLSWTTATAGVPAVNAVKDLATPTGIAATDLVRDIAVGADGTYYIGYDGVGTGNTVNVATLQSDLWTGTSQLFSTDIDPDAAAYGGDADGGATDGACLGVAVTGDDLYIAYADEAAVNPSITARIAKYTIPASGQIDPTTPDDTLNLLTLTANAVTPDGAFNPIVDIEVGNSMLYVSIDTTTNGTDVYAFALNADGSFAANQPAAMADNVFTNAVGGRLAVQGTTVYLARGAAGAGIVALNGTTLAAGTVYGSSIAAAVFTQVAVAADGTVCGWTTAGLPVGDPTAVPPVTGDRAMAVLGAGAAVDGLVTFNSTGTVTGATAGYVETTAVQGQLLGTCVDILPTGVAGPMSTNQFAVFGPAAAGDLDYVAANM